MFVIAEIKAITNDDMVEEMDAHGVASLLDTLRQAVVIATGMGIV